MTKVVIIPNITKDRELGVTQKIVDLLSEHAEIYVEEKHAKGLSGNVISFKEFPSDAALIVVVGGDGSMLDASVTAIQYDIPLVGVNLGKLGYLSEVETDNISLLLDFFKGKYSIDEKMLLSVSYIHYGAETVSERLAVNDVTISRDAFLGVADFKLENSFGDSVRYRADGIILSTPAGSTAYSLSAGGPIVSHDIDSIVSTPICPHSFFNRSVIFKSSERIKLKNIGSADLNIAVDGRPFSSLKNGDECIVTAAKKRLKVVTFSENNMFSTLFRKMKLLEDIT